ncbi:MAG: MFS transporter [Steroidobacteraceae bacterium]
MNIRADSVIVAQDDATWRGLWTSGLLGRFIVLCVGVWLHSADTLITATIAPAIVADIGGVAYINWTITLYEVGGILAGAAAAMVCARFGAKRVLSWAALLYGGGCVLAGLAPRMSVLLAGRLAQGMGGGMLLSLCYLAVHEWFPQSWWNRLFGIVAVIWGAGSLLGPLIGGALAGQHVWRIAFFLFAAQAVVLCLMAWVWLPSRTPSRQEAAPWPVLPLLVLSAATLLIAESSVTNGIGWSILGCTLGTGLLYAAARLDRRALQRLFPLQLLDVRHPVGAGLAMVFTLSAATTGFWAYGPLILQVLFGTRPLISGYILAGEAIAWSLATLAVSEVPASAEQRLIRVGATLTALGAAGFAIAVPAGTLAGMVLCALLQGLGFGLCWPLIVQRMARLSAEAERPLAVASPATLQRIGYAVGTAAAGIAANLSGLAAGISLTATKAAAFWVFAAFVPVLALALICAWTFTGESPLGMQAAPP